MGRNKIQIKRIANDKKRRVTLSKRQTGLYKKAEEIGILCDFRVAVILLGPNGEVHEFASDDINGILKDYITRTSSNILVETVEFEASDGDNVKRGEENKVKVEIISAFEEVVPTQELEMPVSKDVQYQQSSTFPADSFAKEPAISPSSGFDVYLGYESMEEDNRDSNKADTFSGLDSSLNILDGFEPGSETSNLEAQLDDIDLFKFLGDDQTAEFLVKHQTSRLQCY